MRKFQTHARLNSHRISVLLVLLLLLPGLGWGQISITASGVAVTENFNASLNQVNGDKTSLPAGWDFTENGSQADNTYALSTGSSNTGDTYSFGVAGNAERAFGTLQTGRLNPTIGAIFTNNTGVTITSLAISYTGEQWRLGAAGRTDRLDFQYSSTAADITSTGFISFNGLDFVAPVTTGSVRALVGNNAANQTAVTGTITGLSIAAGSTFAIRWQDFAAFGNDDGLGIDDFSLTANPPAISNLTPNSVVAGGPDVPLTVDGRYFEPGATVYFNGAALATTYVSATQLTALVPAAATATAGTRAVTVQNTPGGAASVAAGFVVSVPGAATLVATPNNLMGFTYLVGNGPSASQSYSLSGTNLRGGLVSVNSAGTRYEVSFDNVTFGGVIGFFFNGGTLPATPVYVRLIAGLGASNYTNDIQNGGPGANTIDVNVSGTVTAPMPPTVTVTGALVPFNTLAGSASAFQTLTVSGLNLLAGVTITPPAGYEVSINGGATYATGAQTLGVLGTLLGTAVRVRLTGTTPTAGLGATLQIRSGTANKDQPVSGTVVPEPTAAPTVVAGTPGATTVTLTLSGGNGSSYLVVVRPAASPAVPPTDATTYAATSAYGMSGAGNTTGPANYVVFAGSAATTSVGVSGLSPTTTYVADVYAYNEGSVAGFENYLPTGGSSAPFRTPVPPPTLAGQLFLEDDFDYAPNTVLTSQGWVYAGTDAVPAVATSSGNLLSTTYPKGAALSAPSPLASSVVALGASGQDVLKSGVRPASATIYSAAIINVSAARSGAYFMALTTGSSTSYRGRVFIRQASGGFVFGLSSGTETEQYDPQGRVFSFNTSYVVVTKVEKSAATNNLDIVSLFALPVDVDISEEPLTPLITVFPNVATSATLNAVLLRQATSSTSPTLTIDGVRLATGWGAAVGRPDFVSAGAALNPGNYFDVTVSNGDNVTLTGPVRVENNLTLTSGILNASAASPLVLYPDATVAGGSDGSFVNGPVARITPAGIAAATAYVFPVGKGTAYRPVTLSTQAQASATTYTAEVFNQSARGTSADAPLTRVSNIRYATITPDVQPTGYVGTVTLSFGPDDFVNYPQEPTLVLAKRDAGGNWQNIGQTASTGVANGGQPVSGTLTSGPISSFSDFVLASTATGSNNSLSTANPLPVELSAFTAQRQGGGGVAVKWTTASEKNSARFEVQRSLDGRAFETTVATVAAQGQSSRATAYAITDKTAPAATLYYRLRQVDQDGTAAFSPVVQVEATGTGAAPALTVYPNPTTDRLTLAVPAQPNRRYRILNPLGQVLRQGPAEAASAVIDVQTLPAGTYLLELLGATGRQVRRFVKAN